MEVNIDTSLSVIKFLQLESDQYIEESRKFMELKVKELINYTFKTQVPIFFENKYYIKIIPHTNFTEFKANLSNEIPDIEIKMEVYKYSFFIFYKRIRIGEILNIFYPFMATNNNMNLSKIKKIEDIKYYNIHPKYVLCELLRNLYSPENHNNQLEILEETERYLKLWKDDGGLEYVNNRNIEFDLKIFVKYVNLLKENIFGLYGIVDNVLYVSTDDILQAQKILEDSGCSNTVFNNGKIYEDMRLQTIILSIPHSGNKIRLFNNLSYELLPAFKGSRDLHPLVLLRYVLIEYNILDISNVQQVASLKLNTFISKYRRVLKNINYDNCDFYGIYYPDTQYRKKLYLENIVRIRLSNIV